MPVRKYTPDVPAALAVPVGVPKDPKDPAARLGDKANRGDTAVIRLSLPGEELRSFDSAIRVVLHAEFDPGRVSRPSHVEDLGSKACDDRARAEERPRGGGVG